MFRLPVCPHCGTVYRYHEVLTSVTKKEITCYHCHKGFRARIFPRVLIEAVILFLAFRSDAIDTGSQKVVFSIAGSVFVIFVLTHLFLWLKDSADARRINRDLEKYQRRHE